MRIRGARAAFEQVEAMAGVGGGMTDRPGGASQRRNGWKNVRNNGGNNGWDNVRDNALRREGRREGTGPARRRRMATWTRGRRAGYARW